MLVKKEISFRKGLEIDGLLPKSILYLDGLGINGEIK